MIQISDLQNYNLAFFNRKTGVCLGGKLNPFSDISQNSVWEKRTLHKIQYEENGLFTKFNSVHVYVFWRAPHLPQHPIFLELKNAPCPFLEVKNKPCPFLEVKSKPCPFCAINKVRKPDSGRKLWYAIWKICVRKIPALRNRRFCTKTPFCF